MKKYNLFLSVVLICISSQAYAYIGPGVGGGTIAVVIGILVSIFLGIFAVLYYPIKRILRNKKNKSESNDNLAQENNESHE